MFNRSYFSASVYTAGWTISRRCLTVAWISCCAFVCPDAGAAPVRMQKTMRGMERENVLWAATATRALHVVRSCFRAWCESGRTIISTLRLDMCGARREDSALSVDVQMIQIFGALLTLCLSIVRQVSCLPSPSRWLAGRVSLSSFGGSLCPEGFQQPFCI